MSSQLNVRIDPRIRAAGDASLAELGYTAGEFIRTMWEKLAQRGRAVEEIRTILQGVDKPVTNAVQEDPPLARMSELAACAAEMCHASMCDASATPYDAASMDRETLWGELDERMREVTT